MALILYFLKCMKRGGKNCKHETGMKIIKKIYFEGEEDDKNKTGDIKTNFKSKQ